MSNGAAVDSLLRGIEGISEVEVDIDEGSAVIRYDPGKTSIGAIKRLMSDEMFDVTGVEEISGK